MFNIFKLEDDQLEANLVRLGEINQIATAQLMSLNQTEACCPQNPAVNKILLSCLDFMFHCLSRVAERRSHTFISRKQRTTYLLRSQVPQPHCSKNRA